MSIPSFSVKKKVTITMLTLIIVLLGIISYTKLGIDLLPDIEFPTISVVTTYPGASPEDVEEMVTKNMEKWVSTISDVKEVTSISQEGISTINVEFEWGTNLDFAAQDIRETIGSYSSFLPEDVTDPVVMKFDLSQMPVLMYSVTGDRSVFEVKRIVEDEVATKLERIEGVASVMTFTPEEREIQILLKKDKITRLGISPDKILQIIRAENLDQPAGYFVEKHLEYTLRTVGEFPDLETIKNIPVSYSPQGKIIRLKEVADVVDGKKDLKSYMTVAGSPGVFFFITKSSEANTVIIAKKAKEELESIKQRIPDDIKFYMNMDTSEAIVKNAEGTSINILVGGILVIFLIFLFLANWRPTITIVISIPLSIIATFISFYVAGYTLNLITLIGLGLGVGMLVDNSIVVIENIFRHLEEGKDSETASKVGAEEVGMAITASTLTTIGVFFPMLFASGVVGKFAQALALSVSFALLSSLFVALTIVPMLTSVIFKGISEKELEKRTREKAFEKYKKLYRNLLEKAISRRWIILGLVILLLVCSFVLINFTGTEFMPATDNPMILMKLKLPVSTNLDTTNRIASRIEQKLMKREEVISAAKQVGLNEEDRGGSSEFSTQGSHEAILWVRLVPKLEREYSGPEIVEQIKAELPDYKNVEIETIDMGQMFTSGSIYPVEIKLKGDDLNVLQSLSEIVQENMRNIDGFTDIHSSFNKGKREIHISVNRNKAYNMGLTVGTIASIIHTYTIGKVQSYYKEEGEEFDIRVKLKRSERNSFRDIKHLPIITPRGKIVYLEEVADLDVGKGPLKIEREDQVRKISVLANIMDRDLGSAITELKENLSQLEKNLPSGYFIEYGGQYEDMISGFKDLLLALLLAVVLVYMIMASQFEHLLHPFVIMFTVPLALIGVIFAIFIGGKTINVVVFMGTIILAGIAVNNGIVMIDYINQLRKRGKKAYEALIEGAVVRLRPVLITALSTMMGMFPMIFTRSEGAEMRVPLGLSIVGGLFAATFLTLFIIPIVYSIVNKIKPEKAE